LELCPVTISKPAVSNIFLSNAYIRDCSYIESYNLDSSSLENRSQFLGAIPSWFVSIEGYDSSLHTSLNKRTCLFERERCACISRKRKELVPFVVGSE